jgi:methylated-DNA-[protein]-cysteine S-methyltransferase
MAGVRSAASLERHIGRLRMTTHAITFESPLGPLLLLKGARGLEGVYFDLHRGSAVRPPAPLADDRSFFARETAQLEEYFAGERTVFDLELAAEGTAFQKEVWRALTRIPYGTTLSYGELAAALGRPGAARAVGAANARNPLSIVVPCHRVIGRDGSLTGYAGGEQKKERLLALERGGATHAFPAWASRKTTAAIPAVTTTTRI